MAMPSSQTMNYTQLCDGIVREIWMRSQSEMVPEFRPVMPVVLFNAAIKGDSNYIDGLIRRLGVQPEEQREVRVNIDYHSAPNEINTEIQTVQSEFHSATRFGDTILHLLIINKEHNELVLKVFRGDHSLLKARNNMLETPLYCAAKVGNTDVIKKLIESKNDFVKDALAETNKTGDTALHVAAKLGHKDICRELMNLDSEVAYKCNHKKKSPLYVAIIEGFTEMVESMLEVDHALAFTPFSDGMYPVHEAARMGNLKLLKHFLEKYPEYAKLRDPYGRNFFHVAAQNNKQEFFINAANEEIFKEMEENRERMITAKDYEGNTPFHIAAMEGNREIMRAIWEHFKNEETKDAETCHTLFEIMGAIWEHFKKEETKDAETGHTLFELRNNKGYTPLQLSAEEVVKNNEDINNVMTSKYLETHKDYIFTPKWFDVFMEPPLQNKWERTQVIGLGSVLITTVAFAAAFTMPGGYEEHGTPVLGRRYMFRAFIVANALAFIQGFLSLFALLRKTLRHVSDDTLVFATMAFVVASSSMVVAFGLGMYVMLAPVCLPIAILLLVITLMLGTPPAVIVFVELLEPILGPSMNSTSSQGSDFICFFSGMSFLFIFCLAFV